MNTSKDDIIINTNKHSLKDNEELVALQYLENLENKTWKPFVKTILSMIIIITVIGILAYVSTGTITIYGNSMYPTLKNGQQMRVNKFVYVFSDGDYNDIVLFKPSTHYPEIFAKRLIGKPGDTIEIKNNNIFKNELVLTESYIHEPMVTEDIVSFTLNESEYFFMGDNRNHSLDCRHIGPIDKELIIGKIQFSK